MMIRGGLQTEGGQTSKAQGRRGLETTPGNYWAAENPKPLQREVPTGIKWVFANQCSKRLENLNAVRDIVS